MQHKMLFQKNFKSGIKLKFYCVRLIFRQATADTIIDRKDASYMQGCRIQERFHLLWIREGSWHGNSAQHDGNEF